MVKEPTDATEATTGSMASKASKISCLEDYVPGALVLFSCETYDLEVSGHFQDEQHRTGGLPFLLSKWYAHREALQSTQ